MLIDSDISLGLDVIRRSAGVEALEIGGLFNPVRSVIQVAERVAGGVEALSKGGVALQYCGTCLTHDDARFFAKSYTGFSTTP